MLSRKAQRLVYVGIILFSIMFSLLALSYVKSYIGYIGWEVNASAGFINEINIVHEMNPSYWAGIYGDTNYDINNMNNNPRVYTIWPDNITEATDLVFNCMGRTGWDIYASEYDYTQYSAEDWSSKMEAIGAATMDEILAYMNFSEMKRAQQMEHPNISFTSYMNISFGGKNITGLALHTEQLGAVNDDFGMIALVDRYPGPTNGTLLFGIDASTYGTCFDGIYRNTQFMLPILEGRSNMTYYIFPDPVSDKLG